MPWSGCDSRNDLRNVTWGATGLVLKEMQRRGSLCGAGTEGKEVESSQVGLYAIKFFIAFSVDEQLQLAYLKHSSSDEDSTKE